MPDPHSNFGYSTVATAPSPASSGTSLVVQAADGAKFPSTGAFNATVWPASTQPTTANAEIVRVTAISTDTFTITRAQESTSARTIVVGDQIADTITKKTLTDVELDQYPNVYLTTQDETIPANAQLVFEDYLELAASFVYELASGARLVIGDYATPIVGPGYEIGYAQITANVTVTATSESAGTVVIAAPPFMFDGSPVMCEGFMTVTSPSGTACTITVCLFEGATEISQLGIAFISSSSGNNQIEVSKAFALRFTPTAGLHAYTVTSFVNTTVGTPVINAGAGGTATAAPAFVRFTKV